MAGAATPALQEAVGGWYTNYDQRFRDLLGPLKVAPSYNPFMGLKDAISWASGLMDSISSTFGSAFGSLVDAIGSFFGGGVGGVGGGAGSGGGYGRTGGEGGRAGPGPRGPGGTIGGGVAAGGWARGANGFQAAGGGPSDTLQAWLTPGEFVVNRRSANKWGELLEAMNRGGDPFRAFAHGGDIMLTRPTLLLGGEKGAEMASFRPAAGGGRTTGSTFVNQGVMVADRTTLRRFGRQLVDQASRDLTKIRK